MTPQSEPREYPFWSYEDLGLFIGSVIPVFLLAILIVQMVPISGVGLGFEVVAGSEYLIIISPVGRAENLIKFRLGRRSVQSEGAVVLLHTQAAHHRP